jgi:LAO/AO transport system kinase
MDLVRRLLKHDRMALARLITKVENAEDGHEQALRRVYRATGKAYHVGITGPPGAGKSTLVDGLARRLAGKTKHVGIIAIDPTSPFSGGALLGDRIRMSSLSTHPNVFIRSMATRGSLGGMARATKEVALLMDGFGMDYVVIETIGVGQVEIDVVDACDTTVLVLVPESGDGVQVMKAGLLEVADIMVVNKADRDGADRLIHELRAINEMREAKSLWEYPVLATEAINEKGLDDLVETIKRHEAFLKKSGEYDKHRRQQVERQIRTLIEDRIRCRLEQGLLKGRRLERMVEKVLTHDLSPFEVADRIMRSR